MRLRDELILRCARRRETKLGKLSSEGFAELEEAVRANVGDFIDTPEEAAFAEVVRACENFEHALMESEALDDEGYIRARTQALNAVSAACRHALELDPDCLDARQMRIQATTSGFPLVNMAYRELQAAYLESQKTLSDIKSMSGGLSWENVFARPYLRLLAAFARESMKSTRHKNAIALGEELLGLSPADEVGARHTMAIAYARLEDEPGLNALDDRFNHESTAWSLLARTLLLYRLERYGSARRALRSFIQLVDGGAFALLRPVLLPPYLPARPEVEPLGFDAAMQAVFETETTVSDTPGFIAWVQEQPESIPMAKRFADTHGFDWDNPER